MLLDKIPAVTDAAALTFARSVDVAGAPRGARLYLVGEDERSSRARPEVTDGRTAVQINGRWHQLRGRTATFDQLLGIAFPDQTRAFLGATTISYRRGTRTAPEGLLTPGDVVTLIEGLAVNAVPTYAS